MFTCILELFKQACHMFTTHAISITFPSATFLFNENSNSFQTYAAFLKHYYGINLSGPYPMQKVCK